MLYNNDSITRLERKPYAYYASCLEQYLKQDHSEILRNLFLKQLGYELNLESPKTYNEKLQWLKLYWRNEEVQLCTDKYAVKDYLKSKGMSNLLVDTIALYDNADDIDFDSLPNGYVAKATHASGYNLFVSNASILDANRARLVLDKVLKVPYYAAKLEWNYEFVEPRIMIEPLLAIEAHRPLDYKFYCFHGKVCFVEIMTACEWVYNSEPNELIVDSRFNRLEFSYSFDNKLVIEKPTDFDKMVEIATVLSAQFPHVRVDLLNPQKGVIKFGEFTFFPSAGFGHFTPKNVDFIIGKELHLENLRSNEDSLCLSK